MNYPVSERALEKWSQQQLEQVDDSTWRFEYHGSTCSNGGDAFDAWLLVQLEGDAIARAWVEIPEESKVAASKMCAAKSSPDAFIAQLAKSVASLEGKTIETVLAEDEPTNPAGCFCTGQMVRHKWNLALSTIHYHLANSVRA